jgi:hypothetical protein
MYVSRGQLLLIGNILILFIPLHPIGIHYHTRKICSVNMKLTVERRVIEFSRSWERQKQRSFIYRLLTRDFLCLGEMKNAYKVWSEYLKETTNSEGLGVDGIIV